MQESSMDHAFEEKEIHLSQYLMVLLKRRNFIILILIAIVGIAMVYSVAVDPIYESSAKLIVDKEKTASPITGARTDYENYHSQTMTFNTSIKMIKSTPVIEGLINELKLDGMNQDLEVSYVRELISRIKSNLKLLLQAETGEGRSLQEVENMKRQRLIEKVKKKIEVSQIRDTRLLNISVRDKDPELAAAMVNTLARKYMEFDLGNRMESSKQTLEWLNNEMYELRKKLEDDERKFYDYKQQNKVFSIKGKQKLAEQKIQEFNNKYLDARNRRLELDAKINELGRNIQGIQGVANVRSLINNPMIETMYSKIVEL